VTTSQNSVPVAGLTIADLTAAITGIVAAELGVAASSISPDSNLRTMEGADSVKVLRTVAKIERQYDVELDDEDVFGASTVAEIASVVHRALEAA
jgi:acyl carrier protein